MHRKVPVFPARHHTVDLVAWISSPCNAPETKARLFHHCFALTGARKWPTKGSMEASNGVARQWCGQSPRALGTPGKKGAKGRQRGAAGRQAERPAWLGDRNTLNPLLRIKHCIWDSGDGNWQCQERSSCRKARTTPRCTVMATLFLRTVLSHLSTRRLQTSRSLGRAPAALC